MIFRHIRTQFGLLAIFLYNIIYNLLPFFLIKNLYLRITGIKIGKQSFIHTWVKFTWLGNISIGEDSTINFGCFLDNRYGIKIGTHVMIGHNCKIYTAGHDIDDAFFAARGGGVNIGDYVVIFPNVLVMPNVTLHKGAVIYPGSVVTKSVDTYDVVGGNPATFIKKRNNDMKYNLNYGFWFINS